MKKLITLLIAFILMSFTGYAQPSVGKTTFDGSQNSIAPYGNLPRSGAAVAGWLFSIQGNPIAYGSITHSGNLNPTVVTLFAQSGISSITIASSDGSEFNLDSYRAQFFNFTGSYTISAYKDGTLAGSATASAVSGGGYSTVDLSSNSAFDNIDEIILSGFAGSSVTFLLDEITISKAFSGEGDVTVVATDGDAENTTWSFDAVTRILKVLSENVKVNTSAIEGYLSTGDLTIKATNIIVDANVSSTTANAFTLNATENITVNEDLALETQNGDIILWADSDNDNSGGISITSAEIESNGGDIWLAGGLGIDGVPTGFATADTTNNNIGIDITGDTKIEANGGTITIKGQGTDNTGVNINSATADLTTQIRTSNLGDITIVGKVLVTDATSNFDGQGVKLGRQSTINTGVLVQAEDGAITLDGTGGNFVSENSSISSTGLNIRRSSVQTVGNGSIYLTGVGPNGNADNDGLSLGNGTLIANGWSGTNASGTGSIEITGTAGGGNGEGIDMNDTLDNRVLAGSGGVFLDGRVSNSTGTGIDVSGDDENTTIDAVAGAIILRNGTNGNLGGESEGVAIENALIGTNAVSIIVNSSSTDDDAVTFDNSKIGSLVTNVIEIKGEAVNGTSDNDGIYFSAGAIELTTSETGYVKLDGTGFDGGEGVDVELEDAVLTINAGSGANNQGKGIEINATSGDDDADGIRLLGTLETKGGHISIIANASGDGIYLVNTIIRTLNSGNILVNGTASFSDGIEIEGSSNAITAAGSGTITLTGKCLTGDSSTDAGIELQRVAISSDTGNIVFNGQSNSGKSVTFTETNVVVSSTSGDISILGDEIDLDADGNALSTSGALSFSPLSESFSNTFELKGIDISTTSSALTLGKSGNTANITISDAISVAGPINIYADMINLDADLTTTNNGDILLNTDNALGGLEESIAVTAAGTFKYIPNGTSFVTDITYPIKNLALTSKGLTIGSATNNKDIIIEEDVTSQENIELLGKDIFINTNLKTTNSANLAFKGNTYLAAGKHLASDGNLTHDGDLIFKADETNGDSYLGQIGGSYTKLSGTVITEKYYPNKSGYRLVSSPVTGGSIFNNWQNGGVNQSGIGTHITGEVGAVGEFNSTTGIDYSASGDPSLFEFGSYGWEAITNTKNTNLSIGVPYRLMVKGDRGVDVNNSTSEVATILKSSGAIAVGNLSLSFPSVASPNGTTYAFIANPYQSRIDVSTLLSNNANADNTRLWVWDPMVNTRGAFVLVHELSGNGTATPNSSSATKFIEPGQAFFIQSTVVNPSFTFDESIKDVTTDLSITPESATNLSEIVLNLKDEDQKVIDGVRLRFNPLYKTAIDNSDIEKFFNTDEILALNSASGLFTVQQRNLPESGEEIPLFTSNWRKETYSFVASIKNFDTPVYLKDNYLNTQTLLTDGKSYSFNIDASIEASESSERFTIVFNSQTLSLNNAETLNFSIYPNPASQLIKINTTAANGELLSVKLYNVIGQQVYKTEKVVNGSKLSLDINQLKSGAYILEIEDEKGNKAIKKLIKK